MTKTGFVLLLASLSAPAVAANYPANHCEISINRLGAAPSSHSSGSIPVVVNGGWIGNGELIERVGFYGHSSATNLGTPPECHWGPSYDDATQRIIDPVPSSYYATAYGEYGFQFPVISGTVLSNCRGYNYTWIGTFFVQTNKNTYWLNPDMSPSKQFYFDANAYHILQGKGGYASLISTKRSDMKYYAPVSCN